jgi:hypothetical protein
VCICWLKYKKKNYTSSLSIIAAHLVKKLSAVCLNIAFNYPFDKSSLYLLDLSQNSVYVLNMCWLISLSILFFQACLDLSNIRLSFLQEHKYCWKTVSYTRCAQMLQEFRGNVKILVPEGWHHVNSILKTHKYLTPTHKIKWPQRSDSRDLHTHAIRGMFVSKY